MAGLSFPTFAITTFAGGLKTLDHILTKAEDFAKESGLDPDTEYAPARLIEDQLPLTFQVQNATKTIKVYLDRLTGITFKGFEDTETTFKELHGRISTAAKLLEEVEIDKAEARAKESL